MVYNRLLEVVRPELVPLSMRLLEVSKSQWSSAMTGLPVGRLLQYPCNSTDQYNRHIVQVYQTHSRWSPLPAEGHHGTGLRAVSILPIIRLYNMLTMLSAQVEARPRSSSRTKDFPRNRSLPLAPPAYHASYLHVRHYLYIQPFLSLTRFYRYWQIPYFWSGCKVYDLLAGQS